MRLDLCSNYKMLLTNQGKTLKNFVTSYSRRHYF